MFWRASSRFWRSPALVAVLVIAIAAVGAQPAARRSEASANQADNGLRHSHSPRHRIRTSDQRRILCGKALRDELAKVCNGRGYNGFRAHSSSGYGSGGAANHCCDQSGIGCNRRDLDVYCNPPPTNDSEVSVSVEQVQESSSYEIENTETSYQLRSNPVVLEKQTNNQLRSNPIVLEEPKSVSIRTSPLIDAETENAIIKESTKHKFYVKTNDYHQVNSPVSTRRQSTIR